MIVSTMFGFLLHFAGELEMKDPEQAHWRFTSFNHTDRRVSVHHHAIIFIEEKWIVRSIYEKEQ